MATNLETDAMVILPSDDDAADDLANAVLAEESALRAEVGIEEKRSATPKNTKARKRAPVRKESLEVFEQRVQMAAGAFTATGASLVKAAALEPEFTSAHGLALAESWIPVLDYYMGESTNPLVPALLNTGLIMLPYMIQIAQRSNPRQGGNFTTPE